mmetsp:Transcript_35597/g.79099  ORF Transcript_35597/g.79099 Transcript_35597/m.79099 type:complete len:371 (-) Transcript_35597:324-1436(-)
MALSQFGQSFKEELKSLTTSDRLSINFLKNLAAENKENEALNVVVALQQHLYECPASCRLPALYLTDCILKTVGHPYVLYLSPVIPTMFGFVWDAASDEVKKSLVKLARTWQAHLPPQIQSQVEAKMVSARQPDPRVSTSRAQPTSMSAARPVAQLMAPRPALPQRPAVPGAPAVQYTAPTPSGGVQYVFDPTNQTLRAVMMAPAAAQPPVGNPMYVAGAPAALPAYAAAPPPPHLPSYAAVVPAAQPPAQPMILPTGVPAVPMAATATPAYMAPAASTATVQAVPQAAPAPTGGAATSLTGGDVQSLLLDLGRTLGIALPGVGSSGGASSSAQGHGTSAQQGSRTSTLGTEFVANLLKVSQSKGHGLVC